jgi:hypothetical protein
MILVPGATGAIGRALVDPLNAGGASPSGPSRAPRGAPPCPPAPRSSTSERVCPASWRRRTASTDDRRSIGERKETSGWPDGGRGARPGPGCAPPPAARRPPRAAPPSPRGRASASPPSSSHAASPWRSSATPDGSQTGGPPRRAASPPPRGTGRLCRAACWELAPGRRQQEGDAFGRGHRVPPGAPGPPPVRTVAPLRFVGAPAARWARGRIDGSRCPNRVDRRDAT